MAPPFSQTLRVLRADTRHTVLVWVVCAMLVLGAWGAWFFGARVPQYETSQAAQVTRERMILASFPSASLARIRRGQAAFFHLDSEAGRLTPMRARVADVDPQTGQVRLVPESAAASLLRLPATAAGRVEVVVAQYSPATWVMRTAGLVRTR